jgi:hypothetical protein
MSLIDRMVALNARLTSIPVRFGVPQYRSLLIRHVSLDEDLIESFTDVLIQPKPYVETVPTRLVGLPVGSGGAFQASGGITIAQDDFQISGLPRSYSLDFFQKDVEFVVIDPAIAADEILYDANGNPAAGIFCKILTVIDKDLLTWSLIARRVNDHYDINQTSVDY